MILEDFYNHTFYSTYLKIIVGFILHSGRASEREVLDIIEKAGSFALAPKELMQWANS